MSFFRWARVCAAGGEGEGVMRMTCTLFTERPDPRLMEFAYPDFEAAVDFGLARRAAFASVDRNYPDAELVEIQTDQPHLREVWVKRGGAWQRNGGVH